MNIKLTGYLKLTRFNEYVWFVIITTLIGIFAANGAFGVRSILVLAANWLAVGFAFMINDLEDAPDDALDPDKVKRNPVSAGLLTVKEARNASYLVAIISLGLFIWLGKLAFVYGLISLILGILYSHRSIRLKKIAVLDLLSHCWLLAGLQVVTGYYTFATSFDQKLIIPLIFILSVSMYGELFNEMRDFEGDQKANLKHTAILLGKKRTNLVMVMLLGIAAVSGFMTFLVARIIPGWVVVLMAILAAILIMPAIMKLKSGQSAIDIQKPLHKPLERAAAISLLVGLIAPVVISLFS